MTKLSILYTFGNSCDIAIKNDTGFLPTKEDGFLQESATINWTSTDQAKIYKLSEVYIFTAIIYNAYGKTPTVENTTDGEIEPPVKIIDEVDYPSKLDKTYVFNIDGHYTISQLAAFDKTYYETNKATVRFAGTAYIVYDPVTKVLQHALNGVYTTLTIIELLDDHLTSISNMRSYHNLISSCKLYNCYMNKMEDYIPSIINTCSKIKSGSDYNNVLLLHSVLKAIEYRVYLCDYTSAQKYVEWVNNCAGICSNINDNSCGCR